MRYKRTNDRERTRGGSMRNNVGSRNSKSNGFDGSKRLILIIACIVLAVLCVLLLFQTCKGEKPKTEEQGKEQLISAQFFIYNNVTQNAVTCPSHYNFEYQTSNSITATATDILNLIVLNANRAYGDGAWSVGDTPATSEKRNFINYNYTCYQALLALVEQWDLQWNLAIDQTTGIYIINIYPKQNIPPRGAGDGEGNVSGGSDESGYNNDNETGIVGSVGSNNGNGRNPVKNSSGSSGSLIISITGLIILLAAYITARVKSKQGELVITANTFDKILILLSPVLFFIAWCIGFDHKLSEAQIVLLSLSGLMLQGSIVFSIIANKGNWLNITLSILAKLFIFVLTNFLLLLLLTLLIIYILFTISGHGSREETYIVKYDHFLDQWVGYRVD